MTPEDRELLDSPFVANVVAAERMDCQIQIDRLQDELQIAIAEKNAANARVEYLDATVAAYRSSNQAYHLRLQNAEARIAELAGALEPVARAANAVYPNSNMSIAEYQRAVEVLAANPTAVAAADVLRAAEKIHDWLVETDTEGTQYREFWGGSIKDVLDHFVNTVAALRAARATSPSAVTE